jgi:hypothetical protein
MWNKEMVGKKFGNLTIIADGGLNLYYGQNVQMALCRCDCGQEKALLLTEVIHGGVKSCGCFRRNRMTKHGLRFHPLYSKWMGMKARCYNPNNEHYPHYGGRGITVCDEWVNDFNSFYEWGIAAPFYGVKMEIDRINNNGNYCPENCRWATREEQVCNTSRSVYVIFNGEQLTLSRLYIKANIPKNKRATVRRRIVEYGWSLEQAIKEYI